MLEAPLPPPPPAQPERIANPTIDIYILNMRGRPLTKSNIYSSYNLYTYLVLVLLFGCGYTPKTLENKVEIININSINLQTSEFMFKKLQVAADFDRLPRELESHKNQIGQFDFYLAQSPTQNSGGFMFQEMQNSDPLAVCLKKPGPLSKVTTALTNPIALVKTQKGQILDMRLRYCNQ